MVSLVSSAEISDSDLLNTPLEELLSIATGIRDEHFGDHITYSPKVFIPLTKLCRNRCGYCTFAQPLAKYPDVFMSHGEVMSVVASGESHGCKEALITLGEKPELRYPEVRQWLQNRGHESTVSYIVSVCEQIISQSELLPHINAGAVSKKELAMLKNVSASQGMMLESIRDDLDCHSGAPDKSPVRRLATLEAAGELQIPFTTGLLVGIGDTRKDRIEALRIINAVNNEYGHIQEVIIQNFLPKQDIAMHKSRPCDREEHLWTVAVARILLDKKIHLQAPPNLSDDISSLISAGLDDFGGISPVTIDHVNPERPWPVIDELTKICLSHNKILTPRLAVYKEFIDNKKYPQNEKVEIVIRHISDSDGLARPAESWFSGNGDAPAAADRSDIPPDSGPLRHKVVTGVTKVLEDIAEGLIPGEKELLALFAARGPEVGMICEFADHLREEAVGNTITYVANRNINYTNICTFKCRFCAFSKGPMSLNLRGDPYLLSTDEVIQRCREAVERGATEVCLQGGIHPQFDGNYYINLVENIHQALPELHIHAFSALEVYQGASRLGWKLDDYLTTLKNAGLKSLPGTAAEILDDDIRKIICPDKINTEQWLEIHRVAHSVGLKSNVTIMFGSVESPVHWVRHMLLTRKLQKETGGFTEFVPLPFVHMAAPIYLNNKARRGPTFRETVLMHAVGRICYFGALDNIQASWTKIGTSGIVQLLRAGCNDLGGTLMDENISRAAGASHGQMMTKEDFSAIAEKLNRRLVRRNTFYEAVEHCGTNEKVLSH